MKKFALGIGLLIVVGIVIGSLVNRCDPTTVTNENEIDFAVKLAQLKQKIDTTTMKTYFNKIYGFKVQYPAFFNNTDTLEPGVVRFVYHEKNIVVKLVMFVERNVEGWTIKEAISHLTDSFTFCIKEGEDFFIMSGTSPGKPNGKYLEKCILIDDHWFDYTLYYDALYEDTYERLKKLILEWHPYRKEDSNK